jgi:hypothetical protein
MLIDKLESKASDDTEALFVSDCDVVIAVVPDAKLVRKRF